MNACSSAGTGAVIFGDVTKAECRRGTELGTWRGLSGGRLEKPGSDFDPEIADRIQHENRSAIFPERFLIGIAIAITIRKSLIGFKMKIADRF
jgi:hypothetical protein